ncbi:hypothetical protein PC116_g22006 [Phytophthora cactorum]|nr:hypothetical protein PC116_g22006 [Phytophthora cactorum]
MHEDIHQVALPESMKTALIFQLMSGAASQWYIADFIDLRGRSLASLGRALKREFGSKPSKAPSDKWWQPRRREPLKRTVSTHFASAILLLPLLGTVLKLWSPTT